MIFSIVCEELGLFGAVAIIVLFAFIIRRMRIIAGNAPDIEELRKDPPQLQIAEYPIRKMLDIK